MDEMWLAGASIMERRSFPKKRSITRSVPRQYVPGIRNAWYFCPGMAVEQGVQETHQSYGLAGGYTAWVVLVPELNLGVSVLMNQGVPLPQTAMIRQIIDMFRG